MRYWAIIDYSARLNYYQFQFSEQQAIIAGLFSLVSEFEQHPKYITLRRYVQSVLMITTHYTFTHFDEEYAK